MSAMRVALVSLHTSPLATPGTGDAGGMNVYLVALAEALADRGAEVELLTRRSSEEQPFLDFTPRGVTVRYLDAGPPRPVRKEDLPPIVGRFQSAITELEPFDVLHSHYWLSGLAALPVATMQHAPHIQSLHTVAALKNSEKPPDDRPEPEARLNAERLLVSRSAATVASTEFERQAIVAHYGARPQSVHVIPPGVDTAVFHPRARRSADPYLVTLGRIQPLKGYELALRTVAEMDCASRPRLVIAGTPTPGAEAYAAGLVELTEQLALTDWVTFAAAQTREQAAELLAGAELLLLTSHSETYGLVALEAAASGTPVIAQQRSGMATSVVDGVSGLLVGGRDPVRWADVIGGLLRDENRLQALSRSAAAYGADRGWAATAESTLALYRATGRR